MPTGSVEVAVVPVGTQADGTLVVPDDVATVGWWSSGAAPGSGTGTVVIAGHVDSAAQGRGALFHLVDLPVGATVGLDTDAAERTYRVVAVRRYAKQELPSEVFSRIGVPRLVLITCGGDFDRVARQYSDNVVVYAIPA